MKQTQVEYPDFYEIVMRCKSKMREKFAEYGNSWLDFPGWRFWKKRLNGEIREIWKTRDPEKRQKEIIDAINVLAMMYENNKELL